MGIDVKNPNPDPETEEEEKELEDTLKDLVHDKQKEAEEL